MFYLNHINVPPPASSPARQQLSLIKQEQKVLPALLNTRKDMSDIKNQAEQGLVVGLAPLQERIPRQDIDTFVLDTDVCNLYLLALLELQNDEGGKEKQNKFHWYQVAGKPHRSTSLLFLVRLRSENLEEHHFSWNICVALGRMLTCPSEGIHGLPPVPWDGVGSDTLVNTEPPEKRPKSLTNPNGGYCTHGSILFPTWHRIYIMMMEVWTIPQSMSKRKFR